MSENHGMVAWNELCTRDLEGAKAYYAKTAGWTFSEMQVEGEAPYTLAHYGENMAAGMMDITNIPGMEEMPAHWFMYIGVDDVDQVVADTPGAGGEVIRPPFDIPGVGRIAIVKDATGAAVGMMTPSADEGC